MHTENTIFIQGPIDRVYQYAADVEMWPEILPHYRSVSVTERSDDDLYRIVVMRATRDNVPLPGARFPLRWRSIMVLEPHEHRIIHKHIGGIATGMWVEWSLTTDPWGRGVRTSIRHELRYPLDVLNGRFATDVVGQAFVHHIASRTLNHIKHRVEHEQSGSSPRKSHI